MTDLELLEAAALAIGHRVVGVNGEGVMLEGVQAPWSPLTDDGDAFRLAVKLRIDLEWQEFDGVEAYHRVDDDEGYFCASEGGIDEPANTRRAIVRVAAAMPTKDE